MKEQHFIAFEILKVNSSDENLCETKKKCCKKYKSKGEACKKCPKFG
jgi:hypothetical protein